MAKRVGSAHVATTRRTYKGKVYETHLLRRSYREGGTVKHDTLGNLSHLPLETIDLIRRSLAGETFVCPKDRFAIERNLPHGHVEAVLGTIKKLGLDRVIGSTVSRERNLVVGMIAARLLFPCSKLATVRRWCGTTLAEELDLVEATEDDLYEAMDWLVVRQGRIEKKLAKGHLQEGAVVLYDVSSSYYEGRRCSLAQFGHNRDGKKGRPIIVYGVMTDMEGRPVGLDVYPGNTGDPSTVADQAEKLRHRFGLKHVVLVGDRGMLTQAQIDKLRLRPGIGWISALRSKQIRQLADRGGIQMSLFDEYNLAEIQDPQYPGERLVVCYNPLLAEERTRKREDLLEATEKALDKIALEASRRKRKPLGKADMGLKIGRVVHRHKMGKHFSLSIQEGSFTYKRREESIRRERELDGIYVIRTSESAKRFSAEDVVRKYKSLSEVERAFRSLKGLDILVRPIRHWNDDRVRAHIFICLLAYYVEWHMRKALGPLLFEDEQRHEHKEQRHPVAPAKASSSAQAKKAAKTTADGTPLHSFHSLLAELGTRCRNRCRIPGAPEKQAFHMLTEATDFQRKALGLLQL
jgi:transposase